MDPSSSEGPQGGRGNGSARDFREYARDRLIESRLTPNKISMVGLVGNLVAAGLVIADQFVLAGIAAVGATWMGRMRPEWSFRGAETADGALPARVQA